MFAVAKNIAIASIAASIVLLPGAANATPAGRQWFASLSQDKKFEIQFGLIWTGYYNGFADGQYGRRLDRAIVAFQRDIGSPATGVLTSYEAIQLKALALKRFNEVGFEIRQDAVTGIKLGIPTLLASTAAPKNAGYSWEAPDNSFSIQTFKYSDWQKSYEALYSTFGRPSANRSISYARDKGSFFVASGSFKGRS